jgi:capsular polysaccharide biosynthesis protein
VNDETIDLRSVWAILRRGRRALVVSAFIGALAAGGLAHLLPEQWRSTGVVLLPVARSADDQTAPRDTATQVEIVRSGAVLEPAGSSLRPELSAEQVADRIEVDAPTAGILRITANAPSGVEAESLARAVVAAHVEYLRREAALVSSGRGDVLAERRATLETSLQAVRTEMRKTSHRLEGEDLTSTQGKADAAALADLTAQEASLVVQIDQIEVEAAGSLASSSGPVSSATVLQNASPAEQTPPILRTGLFLAAGSVLGVLGSSILLVIRDRREDTLRSRNALADAVGVPVVASLHSRAPSSTAGWVQLLARYDPQDSDRWTLRQLLRLLLNASDRHPRESGTVTVPPATAIILVLSDDDNAVAVAAQLASYAAETGLTTHLVAAQDHATAASLWAACVRAPEERGPRPNLFLHTGPDAAPGQGDLVLRLEVLDRERPVLACPVPSDAITVLAVSAGSATGQELARVAIAADDAGSPLDSLVVVNPDALDHTSGRLLVAERGQKVPLPIRTIGPPLTASTPKTTRRTLR